MGESGAVKTDAMSYKKDASAKRLAAHKKKKLKSKNSS
jgi:hypothetical protein